MGLRIIGSGYGRTGTMSTKMALEQLGFGPCHHMVEVMGNPAQPPHWDALAAGAEPDWAEVFAGYASQVDFPGRFRLARAVGCLSGREGDPHGTPGRGMVGQLFRDDRQVLRTSREPGIAAAGCCIFETMDKLLVKGVFGGLDRESCLSAYRRNNEKVRATIPAERLLVFTPVGRLGAALPLPRCAGACRRIPAQQRPRGVLGAVRRGSRP
jgi:hypothetical protein